MDLRSTCQSWDILAHHLQEYTGLRVKLLGNWSKRAVPSDASFPERSTQESPGAIPGEKESRENRKSISRFHG